MTIKNHVSSLFRRLACLLAFTPVFCAFSMNAEYRVPLFPEAPEVDGKIDEAEWANAVRIDGFAEAVGRKTLDRRRVSAFIGATETHIYVAVRSQLPEEGELLVQATPEDASSRVVHDESVEVWINPDIGESQGRAYQMVVNPEGTQFFRARSFGVDASGDLSWEGDWTTASTLRDGYWEFEAAIPIESITPGRKITEGNWGINACRSWKQPTWIFSSINSAGEYFPDDRFTFVEEGAPAVSYERRRDAFVGEIKNALVLSNPGDEPLELQVGFLLESETMPEVAVDETVTLEPGQREEVVLEVHDSVTQNFKEKVKVSSADGETVFFDRTVLWNAGEPDWKWVITPPPPPLPISFNFAYYPSENTLRLRADISHLPEEARLDKLTATVREVDGEVIEKAVFEPFEADTQEMLLTLPELEGEYEIALEAEGAGVPEEVLVKNFERKRFPWEGNSMGRSTKVYPPFTPIEVEGDTLKTVLRTHELNSAGLWNQVTATNPETGVTAPLLAAPMRWEAVIDGESRTVEAEELKFIATEGHEARAETALRADALAAEVKNTWDYDGMMRVDLTLQPSDGKQIDALTLVIPLKEEAVSHYHAMADGLRAYPRIGPLPEGEGIVWTAEELLLREMPSNFCTYILLGTPNRALSWFAENDAGWSWDPETPNVEVARVDGEVQLRVHLINQPLVIEEPRTITFGLLAAPVKPRLGEDWRHRWRRDKYTLLGTNINWLSMGHGGDFYPPGKDLWFWHMLRKGNRERVSDELVQEVIERGLPYVEPYGDRYIDRWERHVPRNLRGRYGMNMVFYYNRASHQFAEEFQTFKDEWMLSDFREIGPGDSLDELKVVPTESYIDMALYWYAKSFEHGGNLGVYWDNWYFQPSFNTWSTEAYELPDGGIFPSTGMWGLRELAKRTFVMMNELGMKPIIMAHMTGTNILPILSFCTVQYDWEWLMQDRYGDLQERHERDYILMVSTGELAGTWPVRLGIRSHDDWLWRTYTAAGIVHELDMSHVNERTGLFDVIDEILEEPELVAYRYWDEVSQPVVADHPDLPSIVYSVPGKRALFAVTSYVPEDTTANVSIDAETLGFPEGFQITDVETGEEISVRDNSASFPIKRHDVRIFEITSL